MTAARKNQKHEASADVLRWYEQIIASLSSGVVALDRDGAIVAANPAACRHLGVTPEALQPGISYRNAPGISQFADEIAGMMRTGEPMSRRELTLDDASQRRIIGMTASPVTGPAGPEGLILLFADLTEVRRLERAAELNRQLAQIGELTAGIVHELRNPLGVISGMAELLMRQLSEQEILHRRAETIFQEAGHLEKLVGQFLGFAKPFAVERIHCDPEEIVERARQLCERIAGEKKIALQSVREGALPAIEADPGRLAQALANLIRNAVEISNPNTAVCVRIRQESGHVCFAVEDEGPGIALAPGVDIFAPFVSKKEGGTGLGLSIVHRIVTAHGGTVKAANRVSAGACFEMRIPISAPE